MKYYRIAMPDADVPNTSMLTPDHVDFRPGTAFKMTPDSHLELERGCVYNRRVACVLRVLAFASRRLNLFEGGPHTP